MNIISPPNLLNNSKVKKTYIINQRDYVFSFWWCGSFCLLDIYIIEDNSEIYLVKGRPLTTNSDLIARVNDPDLITGSLFLLNKYNASIDPSQKNLHSDYYLVWIDENE